VRELVTQIPDVEAFLALAPEELAAKMLFLLQQRKQEMIHGSSLENELWGGIGGAPSPSYPTTRQQDTHLAFAEAWAWLEAQGLLVPAEGTNGTNGWRHLSRRARQFTSEAEFAEYRVARLIPREILNAQIADPVWRAMMRGEYDVAVFLAMKAVEVAVREASGMGDGLVGVKLIRAAFAPEGGALSDPSAEGGDSTWSMRETQRLRNMLQRQKRWANRSIKETRRFRRSINCLGFEAPQCI
jgi:hypothetical protein